MTKKTKKTSGKPTKKAVRKTAASGSAKAKSPATKKKTAKKSPAAKAKSRAARPATALIGNPPQSPTLPPVVGIGASAGGLDAFRELLKALPNDTGMAFVLVQHLDATHESALSTLLSTATSMPVLEVQEGMQAEANHVYVIPSNADMTLMDGLLHITGRTAPLGRHLPINYFFNSLAETRGPRAIGVVLSGTASDGTLGLQAIKDAGGITFAQDPKTTRFDGMPRSAINAGCVDFVLPPDRIGKEMVELIRHPFVGRLQSEDIPPLSVEQEQWALLFSLLRAKAGVDFSLYKRVTLQRRLARRMAVRKVERFGAYLQLLARDPEELQALYEEFLILVTDFFRDTEVFAALKKTILPRILENRRRGVPIRVWVAGCSTGQEAYSIAISILESLGGRAANWPIQIFATDLSQAAIERARTGVYSTEELQGVSEARLQRFFRPINGGYQVNQPLREMCVFARHDLTQDPPFSRLDLVSCRNVLIYFEPPLQLRVLEAFHYALKDTGHLLLGKSESLGTHTDLFTIVDRKNKFFAKNAAIRVPFHVPQPALEMVRTTQPSKETLSAIDTEKEVDRIVWDRYAHAGVIVNRDDRILHFRGDTGPYLRPSPGKATFQLMRMLREELALEVRAALQRARKTGDVVRSEEIELHQDGSTRRVNVEIRPLSTAEGRSENTLILFEEIPPGRKELSPGKPSPPSAKDRNIHRLRAELERTREYVKVVVREQETANEELKAANEEALSSMEELQSTNEELETAKEELQSSNEELVTLNEQLQNRNTELAQTSADLSNVLNGTDIPIVILDGEHRVRLFTPTAEAVLGLIPNDVGRLIGKLRLGIPVPDLDKLISQVIRSGQDASRDVESEAGRWFQLRIRPFRAADGEIDGVLLVLFDIHERHIQHDALQVDRDFISNILDAALDLFVIVVDREGRILYFNQACQKLTGYSQREVKGRKPWDFLLPKEDIPQVQQVIRELLSGKANHAENAWITKDGRRLMISWSNSPVIVDGKVESVIGTGIDITERAEADTRARESESTVKAMMEAAAQAILAVNQDGKITLANPAAAEMYGYPQTELIGMPLNRLMPRRYRQRHTSHLEEWFRSPTTRNMSARAELSCLRKDRTEFPAEVSLSAIGTRDGTLGVAFISDITARKQQETMLRDYRDQLQNLTAALLLAQESGNRALARELHDVFSQELAALGLDVSKLEEALAKGQLPAQRLYKLKSRIYELADSIHQTSRRLHPTILEDLGLAAALREECRKLEETGIEAHCSVRRIPAKLPSDISLCLYRVTQEACRNIIKHSKAQKVTIHLSGSRKGIQLKIMDMGDGFLLDEAIKKGGLGLISMEERVRLVGGTLEIESKPEHGTTISVLVPLA